MVIITNISNKPVGLIGGQVCLPGDFIEIKDKDAYCDVFDEDGKNTGEKQILPGLKVMERRKFITIREVKDEPVKAEPVKDEVEEEPVKKTTKKKTTKKTTEKTAE